MAENTAISWCDHTVNFWWGCAKVSPACAHCYAESTDARFGSMRPKSSHPFAGSGIPTAPNWGHHAPRLLRVEAARREAMRYERRAVKEGRRFRVFCSSMSDFFEDRRDLDGARLEALDVIRQTPHLDWLILTKRPEKVLELLARAQQVEQGAAPTPRLAENAMTEWLGWWLSGKAPANVWLGTTVEDQERADLRIPALLQVPARVRFLSCEPLLGPVKFRWKPYAHQAAGEDYRTYLERVGSVNEFEALRKLEWVICGGESGPHARPMHPDWARGLRDQCAAAGVPFLFKQWGEWAPFVNEAHYTHGGAERHAHAWIERDGTQGSCWITDDDGSWSNWTGEPTEDAAVMGRHGKKAAGRLLDGVEHHAFPEVTHA